MIKPLHRTSGAPVHRAAATQVTRAPVAPRPFVIARADKDTVTTPTDAASQSETPQELIDEELEEARETETAAGTDTTRDSDDSYGC